MEENLVEEINRILLLTREHLGSGLYRQFHLTILIGHGLCHDGKSTQTGIDLVREFLIVIALGIYQSQNSKHESELGQIMHRQTHITEDLIQIDDSIGLHITVKYLYPMHLLQLACQGANLSLQIFSGEKRNLR